MCSRTYKSLVYLRRHEAVHQGTTRCPVCLVVYSSVSNLQQHMRSVHDMPLPEGITRKRRSADSRRTELAREALLRRARGVGELAPAAADAAGAAGPELAAGRGRGRGRPPAAAADEEWPEATQRQWLQHYVGDQ